MSQVLAVFGSTGRQGSSVVDYVLKHPDLSQKYRIRAITRDTNSAAAERLKEKKVEVVHGDVLDRVSLETALAGVHTVFAMTTPSFGPNGLEIELNSGKTIADVAVEKGVEYFIFSTLPSITEMSGGKYTKVTPFDAKAQIEKYIRGLPIKSAFYEPGFFMENFESQPFLNPQKASDGTWVIARPNSPKTLVPFIDAIGDSGKFIGAILSKPDKFEGATFCAAAALYDWEEIATIMSKATGQTVTYKQISIEEFEKTLPFEPGLFAEAFSCLGEYGYFGLDSKNLVAWAVENVGARLTTLEEYWEAHPPELA